MKIAVVGSREFKDNNLIKEILIREFSVDDILISGGAKGVDSYAEQLIDEWNRLCYKKIFKPNWDKYGKRAGFLRNQLIIDEADKVIAFWDGKSKGTKHSIDLAIKAGKPLDIYVR